MHKIFVTEALVLSKRGVAEATSSVALLTHELGFLRASARSARVERSKLRYGLEPLSRGRFSLVRGKNEWRLTGVEDISREYMCSNITKHKVFGRVSKLVLRLVQGEEPVPALYETVREGFAYLTSAVSEQDVESIECVLVLRILSQLGYLPHTPELTPFVRDALFSMELAAEAARARTTLVRAINESLSQTGL